MKKAAGLILALFVVSSVAWAADAPAKATPAAGAAATPLQDMAKQVLQRDGAAVVTLRLVLTAREQQQELEAMGVVIDKSGLIVSSYVTVDPANALTKQAEKQDSGVEIKTAKLVMQDGTEQALKVVLRDAELDLIFLMPEKELNLPFIDVSKASKGIEVADSMIILSRMGAVGNRQESVVIDTVQSVVLKPRKLYVGDQYKDALYLGNPVFSASGELVGLMIFRTSREAVSRVRPAEDPLLTHIMAAVLPVADILPGIEQVKDDLKEGRKKAPPAASTAPTAATAPAAVEKPAAPTAPAPKDEKPVEKNAKPAAKNAEPDEK